MIKDSGDVPSQCPYDNTHIVCSRGLAAHLIKCRQNHKGHKKVTCKFDKTHLVPKPELPHHLSVCESRYLLDRELQLRASAAAGGVLSGDVKGPEIITNYLDDEEEDWGAAPSTGATPIALFNRKEMEYIEPSKPHRPVGAAPDQQSYTKFPLSSSKAAKMVGTSSSHTQPNVGNQVYLLSFAQSMSAGWGRGSSQNSVPQSNAAVGHHASSREQPKKSELSGIHSNSGNIIHPSETADELNSFERQSPDINVPNFYQYPNYLNDAFAQDQFSDQAMTSSWCGLKNPQFSSKENLENGRASSFINKEDLHSKRITPSTLADSQQQLNFPSFSTVQTSSHKAQIRPAGRGIFRTDGPRSSSMAQAVGSNDHQNGKRTKTQTPAEDEDSTITDYETLDFSTLGKDDLLKTKRKLGKKLKQIQVLEKKVSGGAKLTDEEKCKLEKRCEIESLVEQIAKCL